MHSKETIIYYILRYWSLEVIWKKIYIIHYYFNKNLHKILYVNKLKVLDYNLFFMIVIKIYLFVVTNVHYPYI